MVLTRGDDFPIHQTAEPIAYAGTDRNFYDRYFFNGYAPAGDERSDLFFAAAMGFYPALGIADAAFVVVRDGVEIALHASRWLKLERLDLDVGPIGLNVEVPLERLKLVVDAPEHGIVAEITFVGRHFPVEEPRFTRRIGARVLLDYTSLTQNGRWHGWIEVDGRREDVGGCVGTRDRSWGVRPVGTRDSQEPAPPEPPQFFWLWSPCAFGDCSLFFHTNDDAAGRPWNRRAVWAPDGAAATDFVETARATCEIVWRSGGRNAASALLTLADIRGDTRVRFDPRLDIRMLGLGYGHPRWGHGLAHGELAVEREDFVLADLSPQVPHHLHVQALCDVTMTDPDGHERRGRGVLEQLALGPHAPSGFTGLLDFAP